MTDISKKRFLKHFKLSVIINIGLLILLIYQFILYIYDEVKLNEYINVNLSQYKTLDKLEYKDILDIRNFISNDIDYNSPSIQFERPKIGWSIGEIIKRKQGLCGEGARLLFHIYRKFGIESRIIYLYTLYFTHVVLEINFNNEWILLETINSYESDYLKDFLDNSRANILSYFKIGPKQYHISPDSAIATFSYTNFSYLPLNALFNNFYTKTEIYVHQPLCSIINYILESPPLFYIIIISFIMLMFNIQKIINTFRNLFKKRAVIKKECFKTTN